MLNNETSGLTRFLEKKPAVSLTLWTSGRTPGGGIVYRPGVVTGSIEIAAFAQPVPPEWLERCIPLNLDEEAQPWR